MKTLNCGVRTEKDQGALPGMDLARLLNIEQRICAALDEYLRNDLDGTLRRALIAHLNGAPAGILERREAATV